MAASLEPEAHTHIALHSLPITLRVFSSAEYRA
jgi:hypothetical protein